MPTEIQTATGTCPTHGTISATRTIPALRFPYIYYAVVRALARRRPYHCPECDAEVPVEAAHDR
jgi:hypothetical protein